MLKIKIHKDGEERVIHRINSYPLLADGWRPVDDSVRFTDEEISKVESYQKAKKPRKAKKTDDD